MFCKECTEVDKVAVEDCEENDSDWEGCPCDEGEECIHCQYLPQWKLDVANNCDQECKEYHTVCKECQKLPPPPWAIDDDELLQILAETAGYETVEDARRAAEQKQKEQMTEKKRKREEPKEKKKKKKTRR